MKRTKCGACGYDDLRVFLDLGTSPIADAYTSTPDEKSSWHPLQLAFCAACRLVQLLEVVDQQTLFGTGYSFYSSASAPLSAYHESYARQILDSPYAEAAKKLVVEIGCNDGDMLRHFHALDLPTLGVDPAEGPVAAARERGLEVVEKSFTSALARQLVGSHGHAGIIIANHVLAHVEHVSDFLEGVSNLLSGSGVAYIEVQYLPDMLLANAFDLVYHEHRNFFTLTCLRRAALKWGLHVIDARLTERQSGSLRVTLRHVRGDSKRVESIEAAEAWLQTNDAYTGVQGRAERVRTRLRDLLCRELETGRQLVGYGAPAKATTLLNFCGVGADFLSYVVDTTEAKQGRYIPGTEVLIRSPNGGGCSDDPQTTTYLLNAWNYADHIMHVVEHDFTEWGGRWIVPIPVPTVFGG